MPDRSLTLAIECSNPGGPKGGGGGSGTGPGTGAGVALGWVHAGGRVEVLGVRWLAADARADDDLMLGVEEVCRQAGVEPRRLMRIAVSVGPGGFTGLRVSIAAAKAIAEAVGARCVAVPTSQALILRVPPEARARACAIALAWKRDDAWRALYGPGAVAQLLEPAGLVTLEALIPPTPCTLVAQAALVEMLRQRGGVREDVHVVEPCFDPSAVLEASAGRETLDPLDLLPLYPREPEAVTKWRQLHPR